MRNGVFYGLFSALLFGSSTPFAKILLEEVAPILLAGLFYVGSGLGLFLLILTKRFFSKTPFKREKTVALRFDWGGQKIPARDIPWLIGSTMFGGIAAPMLLMFGISLIPASSASLLLNSEAVLTSLLAWFVFKENFDWRIMLGMGFIIASNALLSFQEFQFEGIPWGSIFIILSCLCWAIDNNLTRKVSANDALKISTIKCSVSGLVLLGAALMMGSEMPNFFTISQSLLVGFLGYGLSLVLFVMALRNLGTARAGAYFSAAPFCGAALSLLMLQENPSVIFWVAAILMGIGIWIHLTENHTHEHSHEEMEHEHLHYHDEHHQHEHDFPWDGTEPHNHQHFHQKLTHSHHHYPDIHHRHEH
jgi:drug/metabolite transporter (DMT)-like permease